MALQKVGFVPCPNCARAATVGITLDGEGDAVHVYCRPCLFQIQVSRWQDLGPKILDSAMQFLDDGPEDSAVFTSWP